MRSRIRDQPGHVGGREGGVDDNKERRSRYARHRCDVAREQCLVVEPRIDGICHGDVEKRVTVGHRPNHSLGRNIAGGTRAIFDDELLTQVIR